MKAITIYQPWASLIAIGAKEYETRSWSTNYRGPIAIHAAKKGSSEITKKLPEFLVSAIYHAFVNFVKQRNGYSFEISAGKIIAVAELIDVIKTEDHEPSEKEKMFGDWSPGRYAWKLANVTMLTEPIPINGKQGLWDWEETP